MKRLYLLFSLFFLLSCNTFALPYMTVIIFPQYFGGGTIIAVYVKISELSPSTPYNVAAGFLNAEQATGTEKGHGYFYFPEYSSGGKMLKSPGNSSTMTYTTSITTNSSGEITCWIILDASTQMMFSATTLSELYPADELLLSVVCNNGDGSSTISRRFLSTSGLIVADVNPGNSFSTTADNCAYIKGLSSAPSGKYIFIYDNVAGDGRPLFGYMTENNNINEALTSNNELPVVANFYSSTIDGNAGSYGLLYPIANTNGIRRIEVFNADGTSYATATSANGSWSGFFPPTPAIGVTYTISQADAPLPVELQEFTANTSDGHQVILHWTTATEVNSYGFEVQKRPPNSENWLVIGTVSAHGNSNSPKNYSFVDPTPQSGLNHYRLKMVDNDGSFELSPETSVTVATPTTFSVEQNYPNPFNPVTTINYSVPTSSFVTIKVYNILGAEVATLVSGTKLAGAYQVNFDGQNLSSGTYVYRLTAGAFTQVKKMILMK